MKKIGIIMWALFLCVALFACGEAHVHNYSETTKTEATCTEDGVKVLTCECGESYEEAITAPGHSWNPATCTTQKTCNSCGEVEGYVLPHSWANATCLTAKKCTTCGLTEGETAAHNYSVATCTAPKTCKVCGKTEGSATAHNFAAATCTTPKTCKACGMTSGGTAAHNYAAATCTTPKKCKTCGATSGGTTAHNYAAATCTTPKKCKTCGATSGGTTAHNYAAATCTTPKKCKTCGKTEGSVSGHNWQSATCTTPKTCSNCRATEGSAEGHDYNSRNICYDCGQPDPKVQEMLSKCSLEIPSLPKTVKYYNYSGKTHSIVSVSNITYEFEYYDDNKVTLIARFSGTKTYDYRGSGQSDQCRIGWKLYDPEGNVFRTGTFTSPSVSMNESFANQEEDLIYNFEASKPGKYKLVLLDVN